jgi:hypothetical protein
MFMGSHKDRLWPRAWKGGQVEQRWGKLGMSCNQAGGTGWAYSGNMLDLWWGWPACDGGRLGLGGRLTMYSMWWRQAGNVEGACWARRGMTLVIVLAGSACDGFRLEMWGGGHAEHVVRAGSACD